MTYSTAELQRLIARACLRKPNAGNLKSFCAALAEFGPRMGLDKPHRIAQLVAQVTHESGDFRYDREIWGPTAAQKRYDTRADLGNTPAKDGDGELYKGRTAIQITGAANYAAFRDWCREKVDPDAPDFVAHPDLVNTDPWEGPGPLWFWDTRGLNRYADQGDAEMVTKRINGGLNGYDDRLGRLARISLVLLGYSADDVETFQKDHGLDADGITGPRTRAALHSALLDLAGAKPAAAMIAPVVSEVPVAVAPKELEKPLVKTRGFWERVLNFSGLGGIFTAILSGDWRVALVIVGALVVVSIVGLIFHKQIIDAVRSIKAEVDDEASVAVVKGAAG